MKREKILHTLKDFKENNTDKYGILTLGIFGSYARGEAKSDSDLDIVVEISNVDMFLLVHMKDDLEKIFNTKIDIVVRKGERRGSYYELIWYANFMPTLK